MNTPTPRLYLSTVGGKWTVILRGGPLCPNGTEEQARRVYAETMARGSDPEIPLVWDGDAGGFRFTPPETIASVLDSHGGITMVATRGQNKGGTLWRPASVLKGAVAGRLLKVERGRFYQTRQNVAWADYKVAGYSHPVRVYFCELTGERVM